MATQYIPSSAASSLQAGPAQQEWWNLVPSFLLRTLFIYFFIQAVPLDWKFYRDLFSIDWSSLQFFDIFNVAHYAPRFSGSLPGYTDWGIVLLLSIAAAAAWSFIGRQKPWDATRAYYWVRVIVRYRLAIALIAYGFIKFFPIQAPYPSISNLNTAYGDFNRWKLFSLSLGIVPGYQSFLGAVEIATGLLLLYRRTASIGAFFVIIFTGNVFMSNLAYEGGEQVYSLYLIFLALFILAFDIQRLFRLLLLQKPAAPAPPAPALKAGWQQYGRIAFKAGFLLFFVVLYGEKTRSAYYAGAFRFPDAQSTVIQPGVYNVSSFRINKDSLPYAAAHPVRWKDVVVEKWNTISIGSGQAVVIDSNNIEKFVRGEESKLYELEGSAGRQYYSYTADTLQHQLTLQNRNPYYHKETLVLQYLQKGDASIELSGVNEKRDSIFVVLNRVNKKYLLEEVLRTGRQKAVKL
jgi:hypothetical protein